MYLVIQYKDYGNILGETYCDNYADVYALTDDLLAQGLSAELWLVDTLGDKKRLFTISGAK